MVSAPPKSLAYYRLIYCNLSFYGYSYCFYCVCIWSDLTIEKTCAVMNVDISESTVNLRHLMSGVGEMAIIALGRPCLCAITNEVHLHTFHDEIQGWMLCAFHGMCD